MMKSLTVLLTSATLLSAFEYGLKPEKVNDKVYCFFGKPEVMNIKNNGNMVNSCFVDLGKQWLVIDSGPTYAYAKEAWDEISAVKKMPKATVINTHVHDDHWLGNGFYISRGAEVLGSSAFEEEVNPSAVTRMEQRVSKEAYTLTSPKLPTKFIDQSRTLHIDGNEIRLIKVAQKAHTSGDILVYLPKMQTIFCGDVVFNDRIPSLRDGDINGWIAALETVRAMQLPYVIGGHGNRVGSDAIDLTYRYLVELRDEVSEAIDNDVGIEDAVKTIKMDVFSSAALYDEMHAQNIEAAYRMLEWSDE
ncbi:MBL fold metallo-hydrolase [Sulfurimonas sp. HSL3-7]|uniref:MBL fold metallo-hydrolase n=1 Tax=Sulfonitrofixus jiaomeiensis TaxID=3131938 RepID=UPI0031FA1A40